MIAVFRARSFVRRFPLFGAVLLAQLLILAALVAASLRPLVSLDVPLDTLTETADGAARVSEPMMLPPGGYRVTVCYGVPETQESTGALATLDFASAGNPAALRSDTITLTSVYNTVTARLWVGTAATLDDLTMTVTPAGDGQGDISLQSVTLAEQPVWRLVSLVGWLLLFVAADILLWLFFLGRGRAPRGGWGVPALLAGGILLASLPYFTDFLYTGHDLNFHCFRIWAAAQAMAEGQFPVRIASGAFNGYGGATPLYYCDFFLYLPALLYNAFLPLQTCYQVYAVLVNAATMLLAYYSFARIGGNRQYGAVAAFCYTLCAYRLTNLLLRASVGEYTAMMFLPLVVLGAWAIARNEHPAPRDWLPLAFGMAGIVQSHLLTTELAAMFLVLFWLACLPVMLRPARLRAALQAAGVAVGLTAWFLLPCVDTLRHEYVMISDIHPAPLQSTGTYLLQLFGFFGRAGGSSGLGTAGDMPLTLGLAGCAALGVALWCCLHRDQWRACAADSFYWRGLRVSLALCLLALWLSSAAFPWDWLANKLPQKIVDLLLKPQFSWRYLAVACVLLGVLAVLGLRLLQAAAPRAARTAAAVLVAAALLYTGSFYCGYAYSQGTMTLIGVETMTAFPYETMGYDYLPAGTELATFDTVQVTVPGPEVTAQWQPGRTVVCSNPTDAPAEIGLPLLAYRHYTAVDTVTGQVLPLAQDDRHCLALTLPAGYTGTVQVRYAPPLAWRLAEAVTLLTWAGLAFFAVRAFRAHRRRRYFQAVSQQKQEEFVCTTT